ncbi:MAG: FkbM family methyltransferase [Thermoguttaceae bacterium]|nr:FkbM family methyltransferase [Thermoguttaceae bacterium]
MIEQIEKLPNTVQEWSSWVSASLKNLGNDPYFEMIQEWKNNHLPIFLFGCGNYAHLCRRTLQSDGIDIDGYYIDKAYWHENMNVGGKPIFPFSTELPLNCNILICIQANIQGRLAMLIQQLQHCGALVWTNSVIPRFDYIGERMTPEFFLENSHCFFQAYSLLSDDISRHSFLESIKARISGNCLYYRHTYPDNEYTWIMNKKNSQYIVNGGACNGETIESMERFALEKGFSIIKNYAIEPNTKLLTELQSRISPYPWNSNVECIPKGLAECRKNITFAMADQGSFIVNPADPVVNLKFRECHPEDLVSIETVALDELLPENVPITYIKLDIEGAELAALKGARKTILRCRPTLAVCVYHRRTDLFEIPRFIHSIVPNYSFYLRVHKMCGTTTVLYANYENS